MKLTSILPVYDASVRSHWWVAVVLLSLPSFGQEADFPAEAEAESDPSFARMANPGFPSPEIRTVPIDRGPKIERADLGLYFTTGKPAEAKALFDAGAYSRAIAALDGLQDTGPTRFLRALAAHRIGDWNFASKEFEALAERYAPLRDRCLVHAGWGYEQLRDWPSAVRVFSQVGKQSRLTPDARLGLARANRWLKDLKRAQEVIAEYVDRPSPPWGRDVGAEALLVMADLLAAKKDSKGETAALLKLWSGHPLSKEAEKAEARLGDLTALPQDTLIARAESLIDAHRNLQGIAIVEPMVPFDEAARPAGLPRPVRAGQGLPQAAPAREGGGHARAAQEVQGPRAARPRAVHPGLQPGHPGPGLAASTYEALARTFPEHPLADDSLFFAADAHLRRGERDEAMERLLDVVDRYPTGDFAADALFKLFWVARGDGKLDEALEYLTEIEGRWARADDSYEVERARYWRARVFEQQNKQADAIALLETLALEHPATYYGLIAREHVRELDPSPGRDAQHRHRRRAGRRAIPSRMYAGPLGNDPQFASAVELLRLGFGELVPMEILAIDRTALPTDSLRLMVLVLSLAKEDRAAHGLARLWLRRDLSGPITADRRAIWEIAYPKVFRDLVVTHCEVGRRARPRSAPGAHARRERPRSPARSPGPARWACAS